MLLITVLLLYLSQIALSESKLPDSCIEGYKVCEPDGASTASDPDLVHLYENLVHSINDQKTTKERAKRLDLSHDTVLCCVESMDCLLLDEQGIPFCWDPFTTNVHFADGWYGTIATGTFTSPTGDTVNLLTGTVTQTTNSNNNSNDNSDNKSTVSNIYEGNTPPNTQTMDIPLPWTSKGVGSAIPASVLATTVNSAGTTVSATRSVTGSAGATGPVPVAPTQRSRASSIQVLWCKYLSIASIVYQVW
ncbi:hypothetical protein ASPZODRAFT_139426 [Penicilliopsis zonata CBS 506.65]|uniref:LysM domain-containing protein n=1 Tax=Penicilliopsis zonata CBS 506.65 TaxID=1073090 RepID=A0A1L9SSE6_9EURO|nr:hypothetical protein ASPZODRAFT_139426 [Penicilliopsis zonata CBS 506.65]OJJ50099.1 hypothetical protein ASPZODRAFT_139426 [Penicilliopsis zonata CBS 506.65]